MNIEQSSWTLGTKRMYLLKFAFSLTGTFQYILWRCYTRNISKQILDDNREMLTHSCTT